MRTAFLFALAFFVACTLTAAPDRPREVPQKKSAIPNLAGPSNWGDITQQDANVSVDGHPSWTAFGKIIGNKLIVEWTHTTDQRPAYGEYAIAADGSLIGAWNWVDDLIVNDDGTTQPPMNAETLRAAAKVD